MAAVLLAAPVLVAGAEQAPPVATGETSAEPEPQPEPQPAPRLVIKGFGDINYRYRGQDSEDVPNTFSLGQLDLFMTSALSDSLSVLAEVVVESEDNESAKIEVERYQIKYSASDWLNVVLGRMHTALGHWNQTYHHGTWFQTTTSRPEVYHFEDEGGVLPIHEVGVSVRGEVPRTGSALHYVAEIGNGRRWTDLENREGHDQNRPKSTNLGLSLRPERWRGAEVGASFYRDDIPAASDTSIANEIIAAYGLYRTPSVELMAEWLRLSFRQVGSGFRYDNHAGYLQASRAFGKLRPYYRYDRQDIAAGTPLIGGFGASEKHVLGVRLDPGAWVGLKAQYERASQNKGAGGNGAHVQLVFVF